MAMSGPTFAANLLTAFTAAGLIGISVPLYTQAIGNGSMLQILGKPFNTLDTGTSPGTGVGTGVGLTGIVGPVVSSQIQTQIVSFTGLPPTPDMIKMANAVGDGLVQEVALASLVTAHAPIFVGVASIVPGSIAVVGASVGSSIETQGISSGFVGKDWPGFAGAMGNGIGDSFALANSVITIIITTSVPPVAPAGPIPNTVVPAGVLA